MIHRLADCMNMNVPESTNIWQFCIVLPNCKIGENCNICSHCLVENDVVIGNNVTIKSGVQVWDGITIEDNVFIGANVSFTNDKFPRSKNKDWKLLETRVCKRATIGAGCVVLPGITIGEGAFSHAGIETQSGICTINYNGTMAQWNAITKAQYSYPDAEDWNFDSNISVICTDGTINYFNT